MTAVRRRASVGMTLFTLTIVALLIALGVWQLQRRVEKHALVAALTERLAAAPVALPPRSRWSALSRERDEFRRVIFSASFPLAAEARVYSSGSALRSDISGPGTFVFAPTVTADQQVIVVDRGFVPEGKAAERASAAPVQLTGYLRFPEQSGWLTPAPDLAKRLWFARDHLGMAQALKWNQAAQELAPFYIDLEAPVPSSGLPKPGPLEVRLKDDHLQYAITWFALALAVAIAFSVWLHGARRTSSRLPTGSSASL